MPSGFPTGIGNAGVALAFGQAVLMAPYSLGGISGGHFATVRPYGKHLLIEMRRDDTVDTVARLTEITRNSYESAFRSYTGRWEPLPGIGNLS